MTRDPFGANGDFVTAPEISQMFGELIGLWAAATWRAMGSPENVRLVELGPGRGTMMLDALRAVQIVPDFRKALVVHLVEISPALRAAPAAGAGRRRRAGRTGIDRSIEVPEGPTIILANEFFDALPVHQAVMCVDGWHERVVKIGDDGSSAVRPCPRSDPAVRPDAAAGAARRADRRDLRMARRPDRARARPARRAHHGAALVIDYGHVESAAGDTLQAVGRHAFADPLQSARQGRSHRACRFPGAGARRRQAWARACTARSSRPTFLRRLGIETRAEALKQGLAARQERRDRQRAGAPDQRGARPAWASCSRRSPSPIRSSASCRASNAGRPRRSKAAGSRTPRVTQAPCSTPLSRSPGIRHAFFTRAGRRVGRRLCKPQRRHRLATTRPRTWRRTAPAWRRRSACAPEHFLTAYQIHSPDVVTVEQPWTPDARPRADAIVTRDAGTRGRRLDRRLRAGPVRRCRRARDRRRACRLARRVHRRARGDDRGDGTLRRRARATSSPRPAR